MALRRALIRGRETLQDLHTQVRADFAPLPALELFSFASPADLARFQVTTDRVLGGRTAASFALKSYTNFSVGCFSGTVDYDVDDAANSRGGFAAFRTKPDERVRDVAAFAGIELRVKTDGRAYTANFKCADHSPEQLWQCRIVTPPFAWTRVAIPFKDLMLTTRGRVELAQVPLNTQTLGGFGILLADGGNGPFRFEIQSATAIRSIFTDEWDGVPDRALLEAVSAQEAAARGGGAALRVGTGAPARDAPPAPPPEGASKEQWLAWHGKTKAAARVS